MFGWFKKKKPKEDLVPLVCLIPEWVYHANGYPEHKALEVTQERLKKMFDRYYQARDMTVDVIDMRTIVKISDQGMVVRTIMLDGRKITIEWDWDKLRESFDWLTPEVPSCN